jgi:signal transduction histidine kinase
MRPGGTRIQCSPASDVALRAAGFARPRPRPTAPRPAVIQTALVGTGLAGAAGVVVAQSPYLQHPALAGLLHAALIAAMTAVACVALYRGIERRLWLVLLTLALYSATTLDTLTAPGLDVLGQIAWASVLVIAVYVLLSFPEGRLADRMARAVVAMTAVASVLVWGVLLATAERLPEFMPSARCEGECPHNPLRILGGGAALGDSLTVASWSLTAGALVAVAVTLTFRLTSAPSISRRTTIPILVSVMAVAGTFAAAAVSRASGAAPATLERFGWFSTATALTIPCAFFVGMLGARVFAGGALERLVARLGAGARDLDARRVLADALGDPSLTVAFWRPQTSEYVDARGHPVRPPSGATGRSTTIVRQDGDPLAMIVHDAALDAEPGLVGAAGGAALMMLDNARLEADLRASVADLRASRARLASAADAGRREIERNLHDGAQQRLVALRMRLADAEAQAVSDDALRRSLGELGADAEETIDELRSLAHGVYPAVLVDHGLPAALTAIARRSPLPVRVETVPPGRFTPAIEAAVYFCCLEAIQNASKHAGAGATVTVSVRAHAGRVIFEIRDDGVGFDVDNVHDGHGLTNLHDRVAAVGGDLHVTSGHRAGSTVRGDVPAKDLARLTHPPRVMKRHP